MLMQYAKENGFANCQFFVDDGFSGTNFNRPDFQRMLGMVKDGKVSTICVKDLSRLGRDYLQTGYFIEVVFPEYKTRFIAINDNVDSNGGDNEFAPFKNIINEWYAKDCSRKVRSAFHTKAINGEFTGGYPAYGYMKDPENKHHLIPDAHAPIVKRMFSLALNGTSQKDTFAAINIGDMAERNAVVTTSRWNKLKRFYCQISGNMLRLLLKTKKNTLLDTRKESMAIERFTEMIEPYVNITELTEELLNTLLEKVVVHEKEVINGQMAMRVDIYYRFIRNIGDESGGSLLAPGMRRNNKMLGCFTPLHGCIDNIIHTMAGVELQETCYQIIWVNLKYHELNVINMLTFNNRHAIL